MSRLDRALGLLLLLRDGRTWPATAIARRLEVSVRTVYRDVETLSALGVPIYAEMGRNGGFRLLPGYFLPPVTFATGEAVSLLLGLTLLDQLRATPFAAERETAERKLLAAVPEHLRAVLTEARAVIGFERPPGDAFHQELGGPLPADPSGEAAAAGTFLQAILDRRGVHLTYRSPYRGRIEGIEVRPRGLFWDRDRWYLAGYPIGFGEEVRLLRADRVLAIATTDLPIEPETDFDVRDLLGRAWLGRAMANWREPDPIRIRMTAAQAARLKQDWYYGQAAYEPEAEGRVVLAIGEVDRDQVLALVRWLGPGAELLAPDAWRPLLRAELLEMAGQYADPVGA